MILRAALTVVFAFGLLALAAEVQQAAKIARIGFLSLNRATSPHLPEAFLQGLRDLGYVEGRNVVIEWWRHDPSPLPLSANVPRARRTSPFRAHLEASLWLGSADEQSPDD